MKHEKDQINKHFSDHRKLMGTLLGDVFVNKNEFDLLISLLASGVIDISSIPEHLMVYDQELTFEQANDLSNKLYKDVLMEIEDQLDLARKNFILQTKKDEEDFYNQLSETNQLVKQMQDFLQLPEVKQISQQIIDNSQEKNYDTIKSNFYESINGQDRLGFVTALAQLFASGQLKELFKDDERYVKFWRNRILKDAGLEGVRKFDENSMRPEIFGKFIRYVLENRFNVPAEDSVLWGVYLSSLAHQTDDETYEKLAFGDMKDQIFKWNF